MSIWSLPRRDATAGAAKGGSESTIEIRMEKAVVVVRWVCARTCGSIVRLTGHELADRVWSRLSRGELTPRGASSGAIEFEVFAVVKMTFLVEDPMGIGRDPL